MHIWSALARPAALAALAAVLLATAPAFAAAQADAPPSASVSPEASRLGVEVAHAMFARMDWQAMLQKQGGLDNMLKAFDELKVRPRWGQLAREALSDEFGSGTSEVDEAVGRVFARHFTLEELRAGDDLMRGPTGDAFAQAAADAAAGRPVTPPSPAAQAALRAAASTPAGASFIRKIGNLNAVAPEAEEAAGAAAAIGWIRSFSDKASAAEAAASAAPDEAERLGERLTKLMFQSVDFAGYLQRKLGPELESSFAFEPTWPALMRAAVAEEFGSDGELLERAGGKAFASYFTVDELRAGVDALSGPDGVVFSQAVASGIDGRPPPPDAEVARATRALERTPAGLAFLKKLGASAEVTKTMGEEYGAVAMLGVFHRFVAKAEAAPPLAE
jgi:hypothetical protein